jgi:hypothetical protein
MVSSHDRSQRFAAHDFPDFAQEFLSRNPDYCAQHAAASDNTATEKLARTWGLHFPA